MSLTPEQKVARRSGLGGSDIGAICGFSKSRSPLMVYAEKLGEWEQAPSAVMDDGNRMEAVIADWYAEQYPDVGVLDMERTWRHPEHEWCLAHPDRMITDNTGAGSGGSLLAGLEVKKRYTMDGWGEQFTDDIPLDVAAQCHWYMLVTGMPKWYVAVRFEGGIYLQYALDADEGLQQHLFAKAQVFWFEHVQKRVPPPTSGNAKEGHAIAAIYPFREDMVVEADEAECALAVALMEADRAYHAAVATRNKAQNRIKAAIGDRAGLRGWWGKVTWKPTKKGTRTLRCSFKEDV